MNKYNDLLDILHRDAVEVNKNIDLKALEGSSILITGASGLVGLNLISALINHNKQSKNIININAVTYSKTVGATAELFSQNYINEINCDISDISTEKEIPESDYIIHAAGYGQPGKFLEDKLKTLAINTTGTMLLLKKLKKNGGFLYLSSSEIYSGHPSLLNTESQVGYTDPSHPRACYIEGKRSGETIINIARGSGVKAASARLALAYGPGIKNDDKRVLNQLISKGLQGDINLLDEGLAQRTYGYISDVVVMLFNILLDNKESTYNVGGKSALSIKELALKIAQKLEVDVTAPKTESSLTDAPKNVGLDLRRVEEEYDIKDYIDLDYGLEQTINWIKENNA